MSKPSSNVSILPFTTEDHAEVYALWRKCEGVGLSSADSQTSIAAYLARNPGMSFIARGNEVVVGAILGGHDGRRGYIHHLAVHENYRRQGIASLLVEQCLSRLQEEGIQKCHLMIFHRNQTGIRFWQSIGWTFRQDIRIMSTYINQGK